jgi:hypothetical protein
MLFDLRGRGRRRTVQAIYLGLAVLIGLGLIGFGVGGGLGGGGIFNALTNSGSGSASFTKQVEAAQRRVNRNPNDPAALAALIEAKLHQASDSPYYEQSANELSAGKYTAQGKELLHQIANDWSRYLALEEKHPSSKLANNMIRVFTEEGLNEPAQAVTALQILIPSRPPSEALYASLAEYAYKAKNVRVGDLATAKALSLAPPSGRAQLKSQLEAIKKNPTGEAGASSSTATVVPAK